MGGYFMPVSVAPAVGLTGLISQGLQIAGPIIQKVLGTGAGQSVVKVGSQVLGKLAGPLAGGAAIGAGSALTEEIIKQLTTGSLPGIFGGRKKRRRINVLNPRALRRSMRRVQGFSKFARKSFILEKRVKMKRRRR